MASVRQARLLGEIGLAVAGMIWGVNFVLVKFAVLQMPPLYYLGLRFVVGALVLAPFGFAPLMRLDRRGWLVGAGVGVVLFAGFALQTFGQRFTSPGISGFLTSLYVIIVPLILVVTSRRWPSPLLGAGIIVVVSGLGVLSLNGSFGFGWGEILTLTATVFWALHLLAVDYASPRMNAIALVQLQLTVCAVLSLASSLAIERPDLLPDTNAIWAVLWTGVMGGVVGYLLMTLGQRYAPPTIAGVLMSLEAVFALIASVIVGYDTLTLRATIGFVLVFGGTAIARLGSRERPELAAEPAPPGP